MPTVPAPVLDGLTEGLTLRSVEREPATTGQLAGRFERLLGQSPDPEPLRSTVERLARADRIRSNGEDPPIYRLTQDGARRLAAYRGLPEPFKQRLTEVFGIDGADPERVEPGPEPPPVGGRPEGVQRPGWAREALARLPAGPEIRAPFARFSLDHAPGARTWTLRVEQHEPCPRPDEAAGPLDVLYAAAVRLLYASEDGLSPRSRP